MKPLLSICCTSYNHGKYIEETIQGFLIQKTTFPIEILIHDDASTDNTAEIIKKYEKKDKRIITILQNENQYSQKIKPWSNFLFPKAQGKYIALCEGDDYWIDEFKLQKQVDFLEANANYALCFHKVKVYLEEEKQFTDDTIKSNIPETTTIKDLAKRCYIRTNSVVLRNNFKLPQWFNYLPVGDWPLFLIQVKDNKIKKFDDEMAVYRIHKNGVWSSADRYKMIEVTLDTIKPLLDHKILGKDANKILQKKYNKYRFKLFKEGIRKQLNIQKT
ncbi:MAG: glycosyltransferase [Flavobacteriaceae bacterium]|nr:glycosyltransferase [Flavobacteriaceae bacterium]